MRKLKLDVDALEVEEFATENVEARERGTVRGHGSVYSNCAPDPLDNCAFVTFDDPTCGAAER